MPRPLFVAKAAIPNSRRVESPGGTLPFQFHADLDFAVEEDGLLAELEFDPELEGSNSLPPMPLPPVIRTIRHERAMMAGKRLALMSSLVAGWRS